MTPDRSGDKAEEILSDYKALQATYLSLKSNSLTSTLKQLQIIGPEHNPLLTAYGYQLAASLDVMKHLSGKLQKLAVEKAGYQEVAESSRAMLDEIQQMILPIIQILNRKTAQSLDEIKKIDIPTQTTIARWPREMSPDR